MFDAGAVQIRYLGVCDYQDIWPKMRHWTEQRDSTTPDEIWVLQHLPVYTQGQAGKAEHFFGSHQIPLVQSDRGGQITYHGPGQLVVYPLMDIKRLGLGVRAWVTLIEQTVIEFLSEWSIRAEARKDAPGVYVGTQKIASLGLRVKKGCSFHGVSINIQMDMSPFSQINPCGYMGMSMTQVADLVPNFNMDWHPLEQKFVALFIHKLSVECSGFRASV
jgi:lipoyl(octanoyl) transferase